MKLTHLRARMPPHPSCARACRLEVGQIGVLKFGGPHGAVPLHALTSPFSDADGPGIMSRLRFDQVRGWGGYVRLLGNQLWAIASKDPKRKMQPHSHPVWGKVES